MSALSTESAGPTVSTVSAGPTVPTGTTPADGVPTVDLGVPVDTVARRATLIAEATPLPEAWARLHHDEDRCGVVMRDGLPIAVVTAGGLAERWPGGGPLAQHRATVHDVLDRPCGVEVLDADDPLWHAAARLHATGLPALPVRHDGSPHVVTPSGVLSALVAGGAPP